MSKEAVISLRSRPSTLSYTFFSSAVGDCAIAWSENGVVAVQFPESDRKQTVARLHSSFGVDLKNEAPPAVIAQAIADLQAHLAGGLNDLLHIKVDYVSASPFYQRVYEAARRIPPGCTVTYGELARAAGSPLAARAVGQALSRNPLAIVVPCHRIVASNGAGGFSAYGGIVTKKKLLTIEGCVFTPGKTSDPPVVGVAEKKATGLRFIPGDAGELPYDKTEALRYLCRADKKMAALIEQVGPFRLQLDEMSTPFESLAESIVYQQLTGKAAATIFSRVKALYGGDRLPVPQRIAATPDEQLRGAGLSAAKTAAFKDLAVKQLEGVIPSLEDMCSLSDDEIVNRLTLVRGIGRWTVEMMLIFKLGRPDVLPVNDYGVRKGFARIYGGKKSELPAPSVLADFGKRWQPFRSVASWYLWRATEL